MRIKKLSARKREQLRLAREFPLLIDWIGENRAADEQQFYFPMPVNRGNQRLHWRAERELKEIYLAQCDELVLRGLNPKAPQKPALKAMISAKLVLRRLMDHDNAMARMKYICDWLVTRGYIQDDNSIHLEWAGLPGQVKTAGSVPRVEVTVSGYEQKEEL